MAIEQTRGCGYRKVGGLYICSDNLIVRPCDRLPVPLDLCPVCGSGIKFSRGWTWLDLHGFIGDHEDCKDIHATICPVCSPAMFTPLLEEDKKVFGLLWIGEIFYTPQSFSIESKVMGVTRRIPAIPRNLKLGKTVVLVAHKNACGIDRPGIFSAFTALKLEQLIWESDATEDKLEEMKKRNITPIIVPDGDRDHDPESKVSTADKEDVRAFSELRNNLMDSSLS